MNYLTKEQILSINKKMTSTFGGLFFEPDNIANEGALNYIVEVVGAESFGVELFPGAFWKAAAYLHKINSSHVFHDGNKRTGLEAALLFLERNGYSLSNDIEDDDLIGFAFDVANDEMDFEDIVKWFEENTQTF